MKWREEGLNSIVKMCESFVCRHNVRFLTKKPQKITAAVCCNLFWYIIYKAASNELLIT